MGFKKMKRFVVLLHVLCLKRFICRSQVFSVIDSVEMVRLDSGGVFGIRLFFVMLQFVTIDWE